MRTLRQEQACSFSKDLPGSPCVWSRHRKAWVAGDIVRKVIESETKWQDLKAVIGTLAATLNEQFASRGHWIYCLKEAGDFCHLKTSLNSDMVTLRKGQ